MVSTVEFFVLLVVSYLLLAAVALGFSLYALRSTYRQGQALAVFQRSARLAWKSLVRQHYHLRRGHEASDARLEQLAKDAVSHGELGEAVALLGDQLQRQQQYAEQQARVLHTLYTLAQVPKEQQPEPLTDLDGNVLPLLPRSMILFEAPTPDYSLEPPVEEGGTTCALHRWEERTLRSRTDRQRGEDVVEAIDVCVVCGATRTRLVVRQTDAQRCG